MTEVLYLGAVGRSGTTLVERVLGTSASFVSLGEVVHLWDRGLRRGEACGCGRPLSSCDFWSAVGARAFGGWASLDLDQIDAWRATVDRNRYIPGLVVPRLTSRGFRTALEGYTDMLDRLYAAIADVAGPGRILIDASKHPSYLYLLRRVGAVQVRLLHVTRDPRGVAFSWGKVVPRPEALDGEEMERLGPLRAAARWSTHNVLFQAAGVLGTPRRRMRYETFTADPPLLGAVVGTLVSSPVTAPNVDHSSVELVTNHTVSGNPMRFRTGSITIRADEAWRGQLPTRERFVVEMVTLPLRLVYR
jgi:hypothetical protein